jgi:hypothetical protein
MRRLTRRIGLFGGPAALMPAMGVKKPPPKEGTAAPESEKRPGASSADGAASAEPARKGWFRWLWKSESGGGK